jgi:hypothetical protein
MMSIIVPITPASTKTGRLCSFGWRMDKWR